MEDLSFFKRRRMIKSKLTDYGFTEEDGVFALSENILDGVKYLPGYHMNKKSWYTIVLDNSVLTGEICQRIDESYSLALK